MHTKIYAILLINAILCNAAFGIDAQAAPNVAETANTPGPWNLGVDIGYTHFQDNLCCGNNTPTARISLGVSPIYWKALTLGAEIGIQSGNKMRLAISQEDSNTIVGGPINTAVKPIADLMGTLQLSLNAANTAFVMLKGGVAYRTMQFDRDSIPGKTQFNGKLQAGFGIKISSRTKLVAYYQGIYSGRLNFNVTKTSISNITESIQ